MTSQALYNRWRSQTFGDILGQEHITETLRNQIRAGRIGHAYLFTGLRGTGKTSTARILAKAVNCEGETDDPPCNVCHMCTTITAGRSLDLLEIDAASNRGIDEIRELRERVSFVPHEARYKVYVIDEVHMLTKEASNALLKTLEEPPAHVIFIMCTTEPHRLLDTILSRCQRFDFRRASVDAILAKLETICAGESISASQGALEYLARRAAGSFRDAESLLEHVAAYSADEIDLEMVQRLLGAAPAELITDLLGAMVAGEAGKGIRLVNQALDQGADPRQFAGEILDQLRGLLLLCAGSDEVLTFLSAETVAGLRRLTGMDGFSARFLVQAIRSFNDSVQGMRTAVRTQIPLELAVVETIAATHADGGLHLAEPAGAREGMQAPPAAAIEPPVAKPKAPRRRSAGSAQAASTGRSSSSGEPAGLPAEGADTASMPVEAQEARPREAVVEPAEVHASPEPTSELSEPEDVPASTVQTAAEAPITLEWVHGKWSQVLSRVGAHDRSTQAMLRSTYPIRVEGDLIVLGCESAFHRDGLSETRRSSIVEQVLRDVLEAPCRLYCVVDKPEIDRLRNTAVPDASLFVREERRAQREQQVRNLPVVKFLEQRGGKVTEIELSDDEPEE
ncbi:MAG: DNA polymerase III subunit gamma/tau [Anaerolineae bacterium]